VADRLGAQSHSSLDPVPLSGAPLEVHPLINALNDVLMRLKSIVDSKREMLATAAHNLRTPLAAALLHLERVRAADSSSSQALITAQTALRRAARAAHQVLSLAHAEANAADPSTFVPVDLCALAHQMGAELAPTAMEKGHSLSLEVPGKTIVAQGHYDLLLSAAMNLLDNAIKYTPTGGDIIVSVCDGDLVGIRVTDNGPGFTPPVRAEGGDERFVRGKDSARSGISGAGLGLSIVREVASRLRGRLEIATGSEGRGTIATIWVPRAKAGAPIPSVEAKPSPQPAAISSTTLS
jgi:signal transduction histidine kinase